MKQFLTFIFLGLAFQTLHAQNFEIVNGDTINRIDANRKRQGKWIVKAKPAKDRGYKVGSIVEEGVFQNSRKVGMWKKFYPSGKLKSEITYKGSRPYGPYTLYYENGNIEEQGNWERTKNTGNFKRFHENGKVAQEFSFTEDGKRTGQQKYFYENGKVRLEGNWQDGMESGEMKEYYENGDLMAVKHFANGEMDKDKFESYAPKTAIKDPLEKQLDEGKDIKVTVKKDEKPNQGGFSGNGYTKLFNRNQQISKDGVFRNYRLIDGKQYMYNENGLLTQIMIFKNGKYIGDGVFEEE